MPEVTYVKLKPPSGREEEWARLLLAAAQDEAEDVVTTGMGEFIVPQSVAVDAGLLEEPDPVAHPSPPGVVEGRSVVSEAAANDPAAYPDLPADLPAAEPAAEPEPVVDDTPAPEAGEPHTPEEAAEQASAAAADADQQELIEWVAAHNVADVLAAVESGDGTDLDVLAAERAGKNRKGVISVLDPQE